MSTDQSISDFLLSPRMRIGRHALLQLLLITITINVFWDTPDHFQFSLHRFLSWLGFYGIIMFTVYLNVYRLVPGLLMRNRLPSYLLSVFGCVLLCLFSVVLLEQFLSTEQSVDGVHADIPVWMNLLSSILSLSLLVFGTTALQLFRTWLSESQRVGELQAETLRSELSFLKSQINPHFLFNMLNNAYLLIRKKRPEAPEVLFKLEDMLRYQINDSTRDEVALTSDIRFLTDFLKLEKVRRDQFRFTVTTEGAVSPVRIAPLLFIPFVENAVKHNNDSENESYVHLFFSVSHGSLLFRCENSKPVAPAAKGEVGGIGLRNIRRRLELLYPERHSLTITETERTYTVTLQFEL